MERKKLCNKMALCKEQEKTKKKENNYDDLKIFSHGIHERRRVGWTYLSSAALGMVENTRQLSFLLARTDKKKGGAFEPSLCSIKSVTPP
jgi:hypothetical protein